MSWIWLAILIAVAAIIVLPRLKSVPADEVTELLKRGAVVVDVRTEEEFHGGAAPGAINIPLGQENQGVATHALSINTPILLYCASGARSARALGIYRNLGFTEVHNLGGLAAARKALPPPH